MSGVAGYFYIPPGQLGDPSPLLADNIDPQTRDFADLFIGADPVDAAVQVAIMTTRNSGPCVQTVGVTRTRTKLTEDFQAVTEADYRQALSPLVTRRDVTIAGITFAPDESGTVDPADASAQINVKYVNLRALDQRVRSVQLSHR